jgi:hypothetical protein
VSRPRRNEPGEDAVTRPRYFGVPTSAAGRSRSKPEGRCRRKSVAGHAIENATARCRRARIGLRNPRSWRAVLPTERVGGRRRGRGSLPRVTIHNTHRPGVPEDCQPGDAWWWCRAFAAEHRRHGFFRSFEPVVADREKRLGQIKLVRPATHRCNPRRPSI